MMNRFLVAVLCLVAATVVRAAPEVRQLMQLVDYVGVDYPGAVVDGEVTNRAEYEEMADFTASIQTLARQLPEGGFGDRVRQRADRLRSLVEGKAPAGAVSELAGELRRDLIQGYDLSVVPRRAPDAAMGARLYRDNCASCHGVGGRGDGPAAADLNPPPTDFTDWNRARGRTLFGLYNTLTHGVDGTGMKAFDRLPGEQRWALAFHVGRLALPPELVTAGERLLLTDDTGLEQLDAKSLATLTPNDIEARMGDDGLALMAYLRTRPQLLFGSGRGQSLALARERLGESLSRYRAGDRAAAQRLAVSAYLDGFEPAEGNLDAVDGSLRRTIEAEMTRYRELIRQQAPVGEVAGQAGRLTGLLQRADGLLTSTELSPAAAFVSALIILLREGLEAILVIAALAAFLIRTGRRDGLRYLHAGVAAAVALGALTWWLSGYVIQIGGAGREITEGLAALFAAVMLFYVGFWLQSKTKARQWRAFIDGRVNRALGRGTLWGLAGLAFIAVYREIFETVLFYQALWIQTGHDGRGMILSGLLAAAIALLLLAWLILRYSTRLPLRQFFAVSGVFMFLLAIVFAGKGIAALQEAGRLPMDMIDIPQIDLLGIYPNLQGVLVQLLLAVIAVVLLLKDRFKGRSAGT